MDIVRFKGGLGNQMFQYAFLKSLSSYNRDVRGSLGFYRKNVNTASFSLTDVFDNVKFELVDDSVFEDIDHKWKRIKQNKDKLALFVKDYPNRFFWVEDPQGTFNKHIFETENCVFIGYWQTEKYFSHIRRELLEDFLFSEGEVQLSRMKEAFLRAENYVSIHIRRGDYLEFSENYGDICTWDYYSAAIEYIKKIIKNPIFVFCSDDINWTKEHYKMKEAIYIEPGMFECYQPWYDMCLMSCCSSNIIANSSFSWWGAWLNQRSDKKVVAPTPWFHNYNMPDICPDDWVRFNNKGKRVINKFFKVV